MNIWREHSLNFFFEPKGIAVVGATHEPHSGGHHLVTNLNFHYEGPVYPVNPKYDEISGYKCYPRVMDIEGPLDLALIFVPAKTVPQILGECIDKGVQGVIIESSGFAEVGPEGKALQDRCLSIARKGGIRIWGPNCMGLLDISKRYFFSILTTEAWKGAIHPGHISFIVQSGLLAGGFITTLMGNKTLGLAKVCSIGNKCDVEETELLEYLLKDPATKVICLYLESFINGRRFFELASSSDKPIVILKGGKSPLGAEAAASHTASLAGNHELIKGALKQAGIYQADDFFEMVDIARSLERNFNLHRPESGKPKIAILSYSGAAGIVTTDHIEANGLTLARLSVQTQKRLEELSPVWMPVKNPVDYWPAMEKHGLTKAYRHAIEALHDDPEVDGLLVHLFAGFGAWILDMNKIMSIIKDPRKPILFWLIGPEPGREASRMTLEGKGWPTFYEIHRAVRVMSNLFDHSKQIGGHPGKPSFQFPRIDSFDELVLQADEKKIKILDEYESKKWLKALNLKVVQEVVVQNLAEAMIAAHELGYPVVFKGRTEGKVHKTEAGLVTLNLFNDEQLKSAFEKMIDLKPKPQSFLIQPMLTSDLELIVGMIRDPQFGVSAMLGLGGIHAEIYRDVSFRLVPFNEDEVLVMVSELKGQRLLKGYRGSKPVDMKVLTEWLMKLGWLATHFEKIQEIDVNPLLIVDGKPVAVDATIILNTN